MNITGKTGALGYAYQKYKPEPYRDKLYYFKATHGRSKDNNNQEYWGKLAGEFKLFEMECHHNDMVVGKNCGLLTEILSGIMETSDA